MFGQHTVEKASLIKHLLLHVFHKHLLCAWHTWSHPAHSFLSSLTLSKDTGVEYHVIGLFLIDSVGPQHSRCVGRLKNWNELCFQRREAPHMFNQTLAQPEHSVFTALLSPIVFRWLSRGTAIRWETIMLSETRFHLDSSVDSLFFLEHIFQWCY